jgi:hypothetical protein
VRRTRAPCPRRCCVSARDTRHCQWERPHLALWIGTAQRALHAQWVDHRRDPWGEHARDAPPWRTATTHTHHQPPPATMAYHHHAHAPPRTTSHHGAPPPRTTTRTTTTRTTTTTLNHAPPRSAQHDAPRPSYRRLSLTLPAHARTRHRVRRRRSRTTGAPATTTFIAGCATS